MVKALVLQVSTFMKQHDMNLLLCNYTCIHMTIACHIDLISFVIFLFRSELPQCSLLVVVRTGAAAWISG